MLTMAALKGTRRLYVQDQIVIDRPVDRDYPIGSTVRELTPEDDHRVDSQGDIYQWSGNGSRRCRV